MNDRLIYLRTAASKRPAQLLGVLDRKARNAIVPRLPIDIDERYRREIPADLTAAPDAIRVVQDDLRDALDADERRRYQNRLVEFSTGTIRFLGRSVEESDPGRIGPDDPRIASYPRLWFLKLIGFVPLAWAYLGYNSPTQLDRATLTTLETWQRSFEDVPIAASPGYLRKEWTPYSVSLRIINRIHYAAWADEFSCLADVYRDLLFLENNVEYDIGGNHVIENGAALVIGGLFFGPAGDRFLTKGVAVLTDATTEQFLDDGYHYERSPMYHTLVLTRLAVVRDLLERTDVCPQEITTAVDRAAAILRSILPPDGTLPLFNDAVQAESIRPSSIIRFCSIEANPSVNISESGLHWLESGCLKLLADVGDSGPPHLLAHTHNDPLTYILWNGTQRVICDTGTYDYEPGPRRQWARSAGSHNTARPKGVEPTAYADRFLMYNRIQTDWTQTTGDVDALVCRYAAGERIKYEHERRIYAGSDWIFVWDVVEHDSSIPIETMIHFHPDIEVRTENGLSVHHGSFVSPMTLSPVRAMDVQIFETEFFPRFGNAIDRTSVSLVTDESTVGYVVSTSPVDDVRLECDETVPVQVTLDRDRFELPSINV